MNIEKEFPKGIIYSELFMGIISSVTSYTAKINFFDASSPSASHFSGGRYGKGEVGEFVLIEGQLNTRLPRIFNYGFIKFCEKINWIDCLKYKTNLLL